MKFEIDKNGLLKLRDGWVWQEPKPLAFDASKIDCHVFAITLPIAEPLNLPWSDEKDEKGNIVVRGVDSIFKELFNQNDLFCNWAISILTKSEPTKSSIDQKYKQPTKEQYNSLQKKIYNDARKLFPLLPSSTIASTLNKKITPTHNKTKLAVFNGKQNAPYFKPCQPFIVPSVSADLKILNTCGSISYIVEIVVKSGHINNRVQFRLASGDKFGRENGVLKEILNGEAKFCQLSIVRERVNSTHRHEVKEKDKHKNTFYSNWKVKIAVKRPIPTDTTRNKTMVVSTHPDALLSLWVGGKKFQTYTADNLKRWYQEEKTTFTRLLDPETVKTFYKHINPNKLNELTKVLSEDYAKYLSEKRRDFISRFSNDRKCEIRSGGIPSFNNKSKTIANNFEKRTDSFIKQVCAMIKNYALRSHCNEVVLNLSQGTMLTSTFPWYKFKITLENTIKSVGITFPEPIVEESDKQHFHQPKTKDELKKVVLPSAHTYVEKKHRVKRQEAAAYWRDTHQEEIAFSKELRAAK